MKNPISISNIRRPLRVILLLAILLITSNLFISSISQFYIVNREIDNIGRYYRSVGYLVLSNIPWDENFNLDPNYTPEEIQELFNVQKARELFAEDPMIEFENAFDLIFLGEIQNAYKSRFYRIGVFI